MSLANEIRALVVDRFVTPARASGRTVVEIVAGDVARMMHLRGVSNRTPAICSALDAASFASLAGALHVSRGGPRFGSRASWILTLAGIRVEGNRPHDPPPSPAAPARRVPALQPDSAASIADYLDRTRRTVAALVRQLVPPELGRVPLGEQVRRLAEAKQIPVPTSKLVQWLLFVRNRVVYDDLRLQSFEVEQVRAVGGAIETWARSTGRASA